MMNESGAVPSEGTSVPSVPRQLISRFQNTLTLENDYVSPTSTTLAYDTNRITQMTGQDAILPNASTISRRSEESATKATNSAENAYSSAQTVSSYAFEGSVDQSVPMDDEDKYFVDEQQDIVKDYIDDDQIIERAEDDELMTGFDDADDDQFVVSDTELYTDQLNESFV
jgi:hypothetical protein